MDMDLIYRLRAERDYIHAMERIEGLASGRPPESAATVFIFMMERVLNRMELNKNDVVFLETILEWIDGELPPRELRDN